MLELTKGVHRVSDRPDKPDKQRPGEPDPEEAARGEPVWPAHDADVEPEPMYEPEPGAEIEPIYSDAAVGEPADELESLEPEPDSELHLSGGATSGVATRQRVPASRKLRNRAQAELGQLWGSVFFAADKPSPKVVGITSSQRQEGVTQIATALAMYGALANSGLRIALVDCNLRHPRIADLLGLQSSPGLCDILSGRAGLDQCMQGILLADSDRELSILTAGSEDAQPLGLLRGRQFKSLLGTLRERFDHVVLDMPAANAYPDAQIIGAFSDGAVLVVHAARTRRETVAEAKKRLEHAQTHLLGLVLNQRTYPIPGFLYRKF